MYPSFRRAAIAALVVATLAPALVQARPFTGSPRALSVEVSRDGGFFGMVWSLLTDVLAGRAPGSSLAGSRILAKDASDNGGRLDPSGIPGATTTTPLPPPGGDNGGRMDPSG